MSSKCVNVSPTSRKPSNMDASRHSANTSHQSFCIHPCSHPITYYATLTCSMKRNELVKEDPPIVFAW